MYVSLHLADDFLHVFELLLRACPLTGLPLVLVNLLHEDLLLLAHHSDNGGALIVSLALQVRPELPQVLDVVQTELPLGKQELLQVLSGKHKVQEGYEGLAVLQKPLLSLVELNVLLFELFYFFLQLLILLGLVSEEGDHGFSINVFSH